MYIRNSVKAIATDTVVRSFGQNSAQRRPKTDILVKKQDSCTVFEAFRRTAISAVPREALRALGLAPMREKKAAKRMFREAR